MTRTFPKPSSMTCQKGKSVSKTFSDHLSYSYDPKALVIPAVINYLVVADELTIVLRLLYTEAMPITLTLKTRAEAEALVADIQKAIAKTWPKGKR